MASLIPLLALALMAGETEASPAAFTDPRTKIPFFINAPADMFPDFWRKDPINGKAEPLNPGEFQRTRLAVLRAMDRYPAAVLSRHVRRIYLVRSMEFYGAGYGGTHTTNALFIANAGVAQGFTDPFIEATFHHELAHILQNNFPRWIDANAWSETLPTGFEYKGDGAIAVISGADGMVYGDKWHKDGFLAEYSTSARDEDFCLIAEGLFLAKPQFWAAYDKYPRLRRKADLVIGFYNRLDPVFTQESFRSWVK